MGVSVECFMKITEKAKKFMLLNLLVLGLQEESHVQLKSNTIVLENYSVCQ